MSRMASSASSNPITRPSKAAVRRKRRRTLRPPVLSADDGSATVPGSASVTPMAESPIPLRICLATHPARRASLAEIAALGDRGFRRRQTGLSEEVGLGFELAEGLEAKLGVGGEELVDGLAAALEGIVIIELHESAGSEVWIPARKAKLRGLIEIAVDVCECDL